MNSKEKGNIGEAIILAEFVKRGIQVAIPYGDNARYDLIAEFNGKLNKIQIKYCDQKITNNSVICPMASSTNHTTNKHLTSYENDVDYMAFYLKAYDICCLIPIQDCGAHKSICLRKDLPVSGQIKGIHLISDYSFDKILCVETLHDASENDKEKVQTTIGN